MSTQYRRNVRKYIFCKRVWIGGEKSIDVRSCNRVQKTFGESVVPCLLLLPLSPPLAHSSACVIAFVRTNYCPILNCLNRIIDGNQSTKFHFEFSQFLVGVSDYNLFWFFFFFHIFSLLAEFLKCPSMFNKKEKIHKPCFVCANTQCLASTIFVLSFMRLSERTPDVRSVYSTRRHADVCSIV